MCAKSYLIYDEKVPIIVPKRMMVFAGHPDDEIISCGGTLLKYQKLGSDITIVIATTGLGGYVKEIHKDNIAERREKELKLIKSILNCGIIELGY